jgi:hypothetical protein
MQQPFDYEAPIVVTTTEQYKSGDLGRSAEPLLELMKRDPHAGAWFVRFFAVLLILWIVVIEMANSAAG